MGALWRLSKFDMEIYTIQIGRIIFEVSSPEIALILGYRIGEPIVIEYRFHE